MLQTDPIPLTKRLPILGIRMVQRLLETVFGVFRGMGGLRRPWVSFLGGLEVGLVRRVGNVTASVLCLPEGNTGSRSYARNQLSVPRFQQDLPSV
jgi:hypothetical protein